MTAAEFRAALERYRLPQRQLAIRLGVAVSTVYRWTTGRIPVPQYAVAYLELLASEREQK